MSETTIEWTRDPATGRMGKTWNPVRGCVKISAGCKHCYAATFAERFRGVPGHPYEQGFDPRLVPEKLAEPATWASPTVCFVNSMSDLFQADVPSAYVAKVWQTMRLANWHIYQVLTKRADAMREWAKGYDKHGGPLLQNVWLGVSVENRKHGVPRIDCLRETPAAVRFLSVEPLLEDLGALDLRSIDLVIVGGESGPGARPMDPAWVRSIRDQCQAQGARFFFKQWGGVRKKETGRELDGRAWDDMPEMTRAPYPGRKKAAQIHKFLESVARDDYSRPA
jgi:protein gp37